MQYKYTECSTYAAVAELAEESAEERHSNTPPQIGGWETPNLPRIEW